MKIYLIRHGEKEKDVFESKLTEKGRKQMELIATRIDKNVSLLHASSNPRSIESAEIISKITNKKVKIISTIRELSRDVFFLEKENVAMEEKENINNIKKFIDSIIESGEDSILVMHAGINRLIISYLIGIPLKETIKITQDLGNISELELKEIYGKKIWCINNLNSIEHLNGN